MAKAKRVFEIAKELGVASKAIVEKCQAENVPGVTNHMSTVKLGLQQTIREWFSDAAAEAEAESADAGGTAVEVAERVDLQKARRKAKRKAASSASAESHRGAESSGATATEVAEPPRSQTANRAAAGAAAPTPEDPPASAETPPPTATSASAASVEAPAEDKAAAATSEASGAQAPAEPTTEPGATESSPAAQAEAEQAAAEDMPSQAADVDAAAGDKSVSPAGRPNVPSRPDVVTPRGSQLAKPKEATLKGPKVVRVEQPDQIRAPRSRSGPGGPGGSGGGGFGGGPQSSSGPETGGGVRSSRGPARGRGAGKGAEQDAGARKRRSLTSRRGRTADALPTGPSKYSEQDLMELDARLKGSPGFLKQRRRDLRSKGGPGGQAAQSPAQVGGKVEIAEPIFIKDLSAATGIKTAAIIKYLFKKGTMATINSSIDAEAAMEIALEYDIELVVREKQSAAQQIEQQFDQREAVDLQPRPPVVTIMGHVDHGKTSLLDRIRRADVAAHEAGGITQHVGAYRVTIEGSDGQHKSVVFLDTPGHQAFTTMRARGANMTDIVVLLVAADDGVMPQTIESINHAKAAGVPIIVALNKIDKPEATEDNLRRIYGQLAEHGLNPAEWGGETEIVKTSAESGQGVEDLVEILDLQAEMMELKADFGGPARGSVIEAEMLPGRGPVARILVQQGSLNVGDFVVIGRAFGRVRDIVDDRGQSIQQAGPATPVSISGIDQVPDAGERCYITSSLHQAEQIAMQQRESEREEQLATKNKVTLDNFAEQLAAGEQRELRIVLKADVHGSIETLQKSLAEMTNEEVRVRVLHASVGGITESDVLLADASDAIIIGFHVVAPPVVRDLAEERRVDVRMYRIIYELTADVKAALEGMLEPEKREEELGTAEVRDTFNVSRVGTIAGCYVTDGVMQRGARVRVVRDGVVVTDNRELDSLRRVKDDVREVRAGTECGVKVAGFNDVKPGDQIVCYQVKEIRRTLD